MTDIEKLSLMFAAVIHDVGHPGKNTLFLLNTKHDLSIQYNDNSPLENYHLYIAFSQLTGDKNFLSILQPSQYKLLRKMTIIMVLATDMAKHFNLNDTIRNKVDSNNSLDLDADKEDFLSFILHCADISAQTRSWDVAFIWGNKISLEFFSQGDKERELGLPISMLCDRYTVNVGKSQIGQLNFIVNPTYQILSAIVDCSINIANIQENKDKQEELGNKVEETAALTSYTAVPNFVIPKF